MHDNTSQFSRRRALQLGGLTLGGLAAAACSPPASNTPGTSSASGSAPSGDGPLKPEGKPSGEISIADDNTNAVFKDGLIKAFEEQTGIKVKTYTQGNFNDLHDKFATMFAAQDTSVDVIMTWAGWSAEFGQAGWLQELDKSTLPTDVIQPALDAVSWSDKVYGLPKFASVQTMFWAKPMFSEAGLDPEKGPANWDEFVTAAKALTKNGKYGYCCDIGNPAGAYQNFLRVLLLNGGEMYDANYKPTFNSEAGVEALTKFIELYTVHKVMDPASLQITNASDLGDLFARGETGIVFNWPFQWAVATKEGSKLTKETVGNAIIPGMKAKSASIDGSEGFAISKFSKNKQAALAWLQFAASAQCQKEIVAKEGWFPVSQAALDDPASVAALPVLKTYKESTQYVTKRYGTPWSSELDQLLSVQVHEAMQQKISAKEALDAAVKATEPLVAKYLK